MYYARFVILLNLLTPSYVSESPFPTDSQNEPCNEWDLDTMQWTKYPKC